MGEKLLLARTLRTFGYGYLAVVRAIYLQTIGLNDGQIGAVLTAALVGQRSRTCAGPSRSTASAAGEQQQS